LLSSAVLVKDINPGGDSNPDPAIGDGRFQQAFTQVNGTIFFTADDGVHGRELWKSDGTEAGTMMVKDINPGAGSSSPLVLRNENGTLYFRANDGVDGTQLWKSDGTEAGTVMVTDINPLGNSSIDIGPEINGTVFFAANDGVHGRELWKTDGTAAGTMMVTDLNPGAGDGIYAFLPELNGTVLFIGNNGTTGFELWKSDGTAAGTVLVKDINVGPNGSLGSDDFAVVNGTLFLTADDGVHGKELWKTDGTAAGTVMVADINPGSGASDPLTLTDVNGTLFFTAADGVHGRELWKSDGTTAGTVMVADINPGPNSSLASYGEVPLTNVNGTLFFPADDGVHGWEIWKSDGTAAGTVLVADLQPGSANGIEFVGSIQSFGEVASANGLYFFNFNSAASRPDKGLWQSDGTAAGTVQATPFEDSDYLTNVNGTLFFSANDSIHGRELMKLELNQPPTANAGGPYSMTYGGPLTLDASASTDPDGDTLTYSWTINGQANAATTVNPTLSWSQLQALGVNSTGSFSVSVQVDDGHGHTVTSSTATVTVNPDATTTTVVTSAAGNTSAFGQALSFTATVSANAPGSGTPTGSVDFFDTTTATDLGSATLSGGQATLSTATLPSGNDTITLSYGGDGNFLASSTSVTVTILPSIYVLNSTLSGALSLSGNASIQITGLVDVGSNSASALSATSNTKVTASAIQVVGGVSGNGTFSTAPVPGAAAVTDPLNGLAVPSSTVSQGSVNLTHGSLTICPGIYSQITVSGSGSLTLNPGIYVLAGGGLTVTGNGSLSGTGVLLYNAGSNFPGTGGNFGGITLSGKGTVSLTAAGSGPYAGIVIFQSRDNPRALSLSGQAALGLNGGLVYAPDALLSLSGNAQVQGPLVVNRLQLSGNVSSSMTADGAGGNTGATAGELLAGNLYLYVSDPNGLFSADELARVQDAINGLDTLLGPYSITITEVGDAGSANLVLDTGATSATGGMSTGVLGCFTAATAEITLIQGWNWYAGADTSAIGAGQYDFQTVVTHELGHALGLGHNPSASSVMYATLAAGAVRRVMTAPDLNIGDTSGAPDALHAAGFGPVEGNHPVSAAPPGPAAVRGGRDLLIGPAGDDLLIAGSADYDNRFTRADHEQALAAVMAGWTRTDADFAMRVNYLENGGGLNGGYRLHTSTAQDDTPVDQVDLLNGWADMDWYIYRAGEDKAVGETSLEKAVPISNLG
jgi:ELWxxDGT repeat protein